MKILLVRNQILISIFKQILIALTLEKSQFNDYGLIHYSNWILKKGRYPISKKSDLQFHAWVWLRRGIRSSELARFGVTDRSWLMIDQIC